MKSTTPESPLGGCRHGGQNTWQNRYLERNLCSRKHGQINGNIAVIMLQYQCRSNLGHDTGIKRVYVNMAI